jgi:rhodanese-related sulfurtransferase
VSRSRCARLALLAVAALAIGGAFELARAGHAGDVSLLTVRSDYVKRLLDAREPMLLVDFRKPAEYRAGHLPGAISLPITELDRRFQEIPPIARAVLYCQCPLEEIATAYTFLWNQGYRNHIVLEDGFDGWLRRQYPIAK